MPPRNHVSIRTRTRLTLALILALAGCASPPSPRLQRADTQLVSTSIGAAARDEVQQADVTPVVRRASAPDLVKREPSTASEADALPAPTSTGRRPRFYGESASFSFSDESIQAVAKAVLGEMLRQRYTIAPGVQGTVTLISPNPISPEDALRLLERALIANGLRLLYSNGSFQILQAEQALTSGLTAPSVRAGGSGVGYETKIIPLRWIGAAEMEKLLKPYARPAAIVDVDPARNQIALAGSQEELGNYLQIIDTFDVDWMSTMSVASIPVGSGRASALSTELERIFGAQSGLPMAGIVRFIPLDGAGSVIAISPRPQVLDQVLAWADRFDASGGDAPRIYSYDLKYLGAKELASRLSELIDHASVAIDDPSVSDGRPGGAKAETASLSRDAVSASNLGISAVEETNSVLVRATPAVWKSIRNAIVRLDVMPLQVRLETQIAEVRINNALRYGVSSFFDQAVTDPTNQGGAGLPAQAESAWRSVRGSIQPADQGLGWVFRSRNAAAIIGVLDSVSDVRVLQTPSILVKNNTEALLNSGSRIPVVSVQLNGTSGSDVYSQVQYLDTGLILKVKPRVTREGNVFLEIEQEVSTPGAVGTAGANGNVRIDTNKMKTEVTIRAGDTVLLAGLTRQDAARSSSGAPGISRIPGLGGLFGQQGQDHSRDELVMLITATIASDIADMRSMTDDYLKRFRAITPMLEP